MRGLETRIAYATAKINQRFVPSTGISDDMYFALLDAEWLGRSDYECGQSTPPILLLDERDLINSWQQGYDSAAEMAEMADCPGCNNDAGNPCCIHG